MKKIILVDERNCRVSFITDFRKWKGIKMQLESHSSPMAQQVKNLPAMQEETWVQSLGQEDPLEKDMATHSSLLA